MVCTIVPLFFKTLYILLFLRCNFLYNFLNIKRHFKKYFFIIDLKIYGTMVQFTIFAVIQRKIVYHFNFKSGTDFFAKPWKVALISHFWHVPFVPRIFSKVVHFGVWFSKRIKITVLIRKTNKDCSVKEKRHIPFLQKLKPQLL